MAKSIRAPSDELSKEAVDKFKHILNIGDLVYFPHAACEFCCEADDPGWWEPYRVARISRDIVYCEPTYQYALLPQVRTYAQLLADMLAFEAAIAAGEVMQVGRICACAPDGSPRVPMD